MARNDERAPESANVAGPASPARAWTVREHVADAVSNEAQKLVNMAGSIELAKEALNSAVEPLTPEQKEELAKQLGCDSFDRLVECSTVVTLTDGSAWCLTRDRSGNWAAWNVCAIDVPRRFKSKDEAIAVIQEGR